MQRLIARLLLIFAVAGNGIPLALAATAAPVHSCCVRKTHHCHDSAGTESEPLIIRSAGCCTHDCCRAATTSQWANPQPKATATSAEKVDAPVAELHSEAPAGELSQSQSTRAPPQAA